MGRFCGIGTSTERSNPTEHNIQKRLVRAVVSRSLAVPTAAGTPVGCNNNPIPKPWQARVHRSLHVNTPQPLTLKARRIFAGQHGVVAVFVIGEDRVVEPLHRGSVAP